MKVLSKDNDVYNLYLPYVIPKKMQIFVFLFFFYLVVRTPHA